MFSRTVAVHIDFTADESFGASEGRESHPWDPFFFPISDRTHMEIGHSTKLKRFVYLYIHHIPPTSRNCPYGFHGRRIAQCLKSVDMLEAVMVFFNVATRT